MEEKWHLQMSAHQEIKTNHMKSRRWKALSNLPPEAGDLKGLEKPPRKPVLP